MKITLVDWAEKTGTKYQTAYKWVKKISFQEIQL